MKNNGYPPCYILTSNGIRPSQTKRQKKKIDLICQTIQIALSRKVSMIKENLSRKTPEDEWKNSWHLYADVTMKHNAEGCMKDFVDKDIWGRLKHRKDMWCERKHKPLVSLRIYTRNWAFKVLGSVKWHDRSYHHVPLPKKELFMATRMADRVCRLSMRCERFSINGQRKRTFEQ